MKRREEKGVEKQNHRIIEYGITE